MKLTRLIALFTFTLFTIAVQAQSNSTFFQDADRFFAKHVQQGAVDYEAAKQDPALEKLVRDIAKVNLNSFDKNTRKAYLINAYNILVISQVVASYPIASVQETGPFFDKTSITVANKRLSLTKFEKQMILGDDVDPRLHFVLVCGALSCPPITNFAYTADKLEDQLDMQTKIALNDPSFLSFNDGQLQISKIFEWYAQDFGSNKQARINFLNRYASNSIPSSAKFKYLDYDWTLNGTKTVATTGGIAIGGANSNRYVVSSTIPTGTVELKLFNNLFTQRSDRDEEFGNRSNFFTSTFSALYGVNNRFNAGFEFKYRRVSNSTQPSSVFTVFGGGGDEVTSERSRITGVGPKIRWAPLKALPNFSVQSTVQFPVGDELTGGSNGEPFIDWNGVFFNTQLFNDIAIGTRFSLFTELDFLFEDLGDEDEGRTNRFSTPVSLIFSYFPNPKTTIFALGNYSPIWLEDFAYFYQYGLGAKYQLSGDFEIEIIVTDFTTQFTADTNGQASTFNLGLRYNIQ